MSLGWSEDDKKKKGRKQSVMRLTTTTKSNIRKWMKECVCAASGKKKKDVRRLELVYFIQSESCKLHFVLL